MRWPRTSVGASISGQLGDVVARWARQAGLTADPAGTAPPEPLRVDLARLRLSAVEHRQEAVAHTDKVLASDYLVRGPGNIATYQELVATVLDEQVAQGQGQR